ncbi:MAG: CHASE3 domain-containing protein, partial [Nitrospirales bacterium]
MESNRRFEPSFLSCLFPSSAHSPFTFTWSLTHQEKFLKPLQEAEPSFEPTTQRIVNLLGDEPTLLGELESATQRLRVLLESKQVLIDRIRENRAEEVVGYVRSGQGLALSDAVRNDLRRMEDHLRDRLQDFRINENRLAGVVSVGLIAAVGVTFAFGLLLAGLLSGSITRRVGRLQTLVAGFSSAFRSPQEPQSGTARPGDEIDDLARSFEEMSERLRAYLRELEALNTIGHEIGTIHADGLHGVLKRITDWAVELLQVDGCLLMLRNNEMGCWIVEAASDPWEERLHKAVMLWEEFPVSVRAFETRGPAIGEELQADQGVLSHRRQVIGNSVLSVPLLFQGEPFGVLVFILQRPVPPEYWNTRLAKTFADEAAVAIANARLYDTAHRKEKAFEFRLKQLLSQAEILAHDMKAPSERMRQLATILCTEYGNNLDSNATRWLRLMEGESRELSARIQSMLEIARVGV